MIDPLRLKKALTVTISNREQYLGGGNAKNYEEYCKITGEIRGLNLAISEVEALQKHVEQDDDTE